MGRLAGTLDPGAQGGRRASVEAGQSGYASSRRHDASGAGDSGGSSGGGGIGRVRPRQRLRRCHDIGDAGHHDTDDAQDAGIDHHDDGGSPAAGDLAPAGVLFTTPDAAAHDFVSRALGVSPVLGRYAPGDTRSGEIDVFSAGEGGNATKVLKSTLELRQLGPSEGWFVLSAASDNATISSPAVMTTVPRGPLTVEGTARGFEAAVRVSVSVAGHTEALDTVSTLAGSAETPEPYHVTLDLSKAKTGDVVMLLVQGGTGLETDPGDFGAIPVMVG